MEPRSPVEADPEVGPAEPGVPAEDEAGGEAVEDEAEGVTANVRDGGFLEEDEEDDDDIAGLDCQCHSSTPLNVTHDFT